MTRVKSLARKTHKATLKRAKGYRQRRRTSFRAAREAELHAGQYAYAGRKNRKRDLRKLWIVRLNAAARSKGLTYSKLVSSLKEANIDLDRKILAEIAVSDPQTFSKIIDEIKTT